MKASLKEILESIPDFDDFMKLASEIAELSFKKMQLENLIKGREAQTVAIVTSTPDYFVNGKPPTMSYVESVFKYAGIDGTLIDEREKLADITAQLEKKKLQYSIYKEMIGLFQTVSANERNQGF